ncbi:unnamed protein product [Callosobruchus maculatus]|uniref:Uncharacterized protein n=1 Tax=Callosobruchus maculatus TaxID=64391 RepID=A0A653DI91_CALMS|nr:unnamed protein product [Callosobruchus maculatus]
MHLYSFFLSNNAFENVSEHDDGSLGLLLQEIMLKTLEPYKCISITMDPIYSEIFDTQWFEKFSTAVSYITIHVEENEDLLSPNDETRRSLMLAKKDSCQLYIILIANGIEAARLLRFGERYIA